MASTILAADDKQHATRSSSIRVRNANGLISRSNSSSSSLESLSKSTSSIPSRHGSANMTQSQALVYTEFVFYDRATAAKSVYVAGDWDDWLQHSMSDEGTPKLYKIVLQVPVGYHEFVYYVNGTACVSEFHAKTADEQANWRHVVGPKGPESRKATKDVARTAAKPPTGKSRKQTALSLFTGEFDDNGKSLRGFGDNRDILRNIVDSVLSRGLSRSSSFASTDEEDVFSSCTSKSPTSASDAGSSESSDNDEESALLDAKINEQLQPVVSENKTALQSYMSMNMYPVLYLLAFLFLYFVVYSRLH